MGSCSHSQIAPFSFRPVKMIPTGEGEIVMTNDEMLCCRLSSPRTHGITREADSMTCVPDGAWYYEPLDLGLNYRITGIQAALAPSRLRWRDALDNVLQ